MKSIAIVYCDGAFNTPNGKTAHGLVRFTERYDVVAVIDGIYSGRDAGKILDGIPNGIPVVKDLSAALQTGSSKHKRATHFVIGLAPDGGRLSDSARSVVKAALQSGLNIDSGLHDVLSDDAELASMAATKGLTLRDIRKTPPRSEMHFFCGKISEVDSLKIAVLGTDSAVGKRTTAWLIVHAFRENGWPAELIGTGQTAWMQGARYGLVLDSLINDFVAGEIEHAVWQAWQQEQPRAIVIEGQGSLMNPAYPGGFEILAAARPDCVVLQHAPKRLEYDGFPGFPIHPLPKQIEAIRMISGRPVVAVTINHEQMNDDEIQCALKRIRRDTNLPAFDVLKHGASDLVELLQDFRPNE